MRLAPDDFVIVHGSHRVRVKPSMRAAYRLDHRHHSIGYIVHGIQQLNVTVMADVIAECGDSDVDARRLLIAKVDENGVADLQHLVDPLIDLIIACYGIPREADQGAAHPKRAGEPVPFRQQFEELFAIATGWLGWTPEEAVTATPDQIAAAYRGHVNKLHAIYGGGDDAAEQRPVYDPRDVPSDDEVAAGIAKLKAHTGAGKRS